MTYDKTDIIVEVKEVLAAERPQIGGMPKHLVLRTRTNLGLLDLCISTDAAQELAAILLQHSQASGSP